MHASLVALLASLLSSAALAQPLGTLFHTPGERARLDQQRAGATAPTPAPPREPAITGYVQRSDGKSTVFLDGRPHQLDTRAAQPLPSPRLLGPSGAAGTGTQATGRQE